MNQRVSEAERYTVEEGWLCLDFANTAEHHAGPHREEHLHTYADLAAWARLTGILPGGEAQSVLRLADRFPDEAAAVFADAVALREAIYRIFAAVAAGELPAPDDLGLLNRQLTRALIHLRIEPGAAGFDWAWKDAPDALDRLLWPVAWSAANLLAAGELDRVKQCADENGCGWLFVDRSRNRSRRWCGMEGCGNRAKARRHYARTHGKGE